MTVAGVAAAAAFGKSNEVRATVHFLVASSHQRAVAAGKGVAAVVDAAAAWVTWVLVGYSGRTLKGVSRRSRPVAVAAAAAAAIAG